MEGARELAAGRRDAPGPGGLGVLAAALAAAQLLPVLEFTQQTIRAEGEGPHDIYPFSIEPYPAGRAGLAQRLRHQLRPATPTGSRRSGSPASGRRSGSLALPRRPDPGARLRGLLVRRGPRCGSGSRSIVVVSLVGSLGQYTSPIWAARLLAADHVRPGPGHRAAGHPRHHADPPGSLPPRRRRGRLLVADHGAARASASSAFPASCSRSRVRDRRAGRHGLGRLATRAGKPRDARAGRGCCCLLSLGLARLRSGRSAGRSSRRSASRRSSVELRSARPRARRTPSWSGAWSTARWCWRWPSC